MEEGRRESGQIEESEEEILQKEKQFLIQDITEEIEHLTKQLAVVNENVEGLLQRQGELTAFAEQWSRFRANCQKAATAEGVFES